MRQGVVHLLRQNRCNSDAQVHGEVLTYLYSCKGAVRGVMLTFSFHCSFHCAMLTCNVILTNLQLLEYFTLDE